MDPLPAPFIRSYLASQDAVREEGEPGFRAPNDADPEAEKGTRYPIVIEPREGAPAPGELRGVENNLQGILSLFYTGGIETGTLEKFRRKEIFDFWVRTKSPQLAQEIKDRLRKLLHDRRNWDMDGLTVIESKLWRKLQPVGHGPQGYSYTISFLFELYAESGN